MANQDNKPKDEQQAAANVNTGPSYELVRASDAETERVRKAWFAGEPIPEGFFCHFAQEGGGTVLIVEKKA